MDGQAKVVSLAPAREARGGFTGEGWVRKPQVAEHFSVSVRTVERWVEDGMPKWPLSHTLHLYQLSRCEAWLMSRE